MNQTSLNFLLQKIAHGDTSAQAELYELTYAPLVQYLARRFGSSLSAEDLQEIASQSILLMYLHAAEYRGGNGNSSAWGWAYTIARNQALKWLTIGKREIPFSDTSDDNENDDGNTDLPDQLAKRLCTERFEDSVEDQAMERILRDKMIEIIQQLTPREQSILFLHYVEEWTLKKIAAYFHLTPARITQILQGILQKFRNDPSLAFQ